MSKLNWSNARRDRGREEQARPIDHTLPKLSRSDLSAASHLQRLDPPLRKKTKAGRMQIYWAQPNRIEPWETITLEYGKIVDVCWPVRPPSKPTKRKRHR